jgi:hypothetical protein
VLLITNVTDNVIIYNFADATKGGAVTDNILTLAYNTATMDDTDKLMIYYDDSDVSPATELKQDTLDSLIETLQELAQRLAPLAGAMTSAASLRVLPVGTVTTTAITSANSIAEKAVGGVMYEQRVAIANLTAVQSNINNVTT